MAQSTVALLGTLRELHGALPHYDWGRLSELVAAGKPDLLCVEINRREWESGDLSAIPVESREALLPLSAASEITLIPIGAGGRLWADSGVDLPCCGLLAGLRRMLAQWLDGMTVRLMKTAGGPRAVNSSHVEHLCGVLCELQVRLTDPAARQRWAAKNQELLDGLRWLLDRDPGRRVLVAVDCRRKHWLRRRLRGVPGVTLVDFWQL